MLDVKNTNKAAFIQRGLLLPLKTANVEANDERQSHLEQNSYSLLKSYLMRKERKEHQEQERFLDIPKLNCDQLSIRSNALTARSITSRQMTSRISTSSVLRIDHEL